MLLAALCTLLPLQQVELFRGAPLTGQPFAYWAVADTYLDSRFPDRNFGGDGVLLGGSGKTILIQFSDLARVIGASKIRKASLELTTSGGEQPSLKSIATVNSPWGEGPVMTLGALLERNMKDRAKKEGEVEVPIRWSANWKARRAGEGGLNWQQAGASGPGDTTSISGAKAETTEAGIRITGIEGALQAMVDEPILNRGFALNFSNNVEFFSSQASSGRPRLVVEYEPRDATSGFDLSVTHIERTGASGLPTPENVATYVAHVKNIGSVPSGAFSTAWSVNEGGGPVQEVPQGLKPGEEMTFSFSKTYRLDPSDHRLQPISFRVLSGGSEQNRANNALEIQENARAIEVIAPAGNEDAVQAQVRFFNEVVAPYSRYSFAREGALERIAVQRIVQSATTLPANARLTWPNKVPAQISLEFQKALGEAAGLPNLSATQYLAGDRNSLTNRGSLDLAPGLMGYGDTRYDGALLGTITLLYEPYWSPLADLQTVEATGLLSMTDVAVLNQGLGAPNTASVLSKLPDTVLLRAMDLVGRPLANMELSFFQSSGGKFSEEPPIFSAVTDSRGSAILPKRPEGLFGKVSPDGGNGVFLVSASVNGVTEWGWLKSWQLVDALSRGGAGAAVFDMRFDLPGVPLDPATNLASEKLVSDSAGTASASLAKLVDGSFAGVTLGAKKGDWIEIDLGRDRTLAEIDLVASPNEMWRKFDILIYGTGQKAGEGNYWIREQDWSWTAANRRDLVGGRNQVSYRGQPARVRYIRIVNRGEGAGKLLGIKVVPGKL